MTYNFQARFAPLIESGQKLTTIRAPRKDGKLPVAGETLKLFTGMRTKACRKLGDRTCLQVRKISLCEQRDGTLLPMIELAYVTDKDRLKQLAIRDGFETESILSRNPWPNLSRPSNRVVSLMKTQLRHTDNGVSGRPRNASSTVTIQITVTRQLAEALERVAETGLFGANRATAAERLLSEQLRQLLKEGFIAKAQKALEQ